MRKERLVKLIVTVAKSYQSRWPIVNGTREVNKTRFVNTHLGHDDQLMKKDKDSLALSSGSSLMA